MYLLEEAGPSVPSTVLITTAATILALPIAAEDSRVSTKEAFTSFENHTGWTNNAWAFMLALTVSVWTFTGYDSAAHVLEEVSGAAKSAPVTILVFIASVAWHHRSDGSFALQLRTPSYLSRTCWRRNRLSMLMGQLNLDIIGKQWMLVIWCMTYFLCGAAQEVDTSCVNFAFARDNALPGSRLWNAEVLTTCISFARASIPGSFLARYVLHACRTRCDRLGGVHHESPCSGFPRQEPAMSKL
ncbi:uncharacterized protein B0H18DRAFT_1028208 [Fomitopsis serialis]|uniref:uncharacterized protein n=1 Tax=Fomitopsis serialis TaxID=139415 RepID=UPI0020072F24|nr:uncharacterized protein B0H18DRAFT_1028208 [Neoantrodia serialis]KAH9919295.1 hypothetical protein B0H18DRAFT_1028208 [Neoantrodia serialis]